MIPVRISQRSQTGWRLFLLYVMSATRPEFTRENTNSWLKIFENYRFRNPAKWEIWGVLYVYKLTWCLFDLRNKKMNFSRRTLPRLLSFNTLTRNTIPLARALPLMIFLFVVTHPASVHLVTARWDLQIVYAPVDARENSFTGY
jgi:hypothetical protein